MGWLHQRPLNFQTDARRASASSSTARGQKASTATLTAAASSSVGVGCTLTEVAMWTRLLPFPSGEERLGPASVVARSHRILGW